MGGKNGKSDNLNRTQPEEDPNIIRIPDIDSRIKATADIKKLWEYTYPEENFFDFTVKNGTSDLKLVNFRYCTTQDPICVVILFHGYNSHLNTSAYLAKCLAEKGYCVVGYDQRGFGKSEGMRSYIASVETLMSDARVFVKKIKEMYPDKPLFIGGLSMGGLITYLLTLEDKHICNGAIMFAPALKPIVGKFLSTVGIMIGKVIPRVKTFKPKREYASKSQYTVQMLKSDPLQYNGGTRMGSLKALLEGMRDCESTFSKYEARYVMFFGGNDKTINAESGFTLFNRCQSEDKTLYFYENLWHDIWHEEEMFDITPRVIDWIEKRLPNRENIQATQNNNNNNNSESIEHS